MKKVIFLIVCIFASHCAQCQSKKRAARYQQEKEFCDSIYQTLTPHFNIGDNGELVFSRVIADQNNRGKDGIFARCLEILNSTFSDASEVIQTTDKDGGLILGKFQYNRQLRDNIVGVFGRITSHPTFKIEIRDGRCRITISFFSLNKFINGHGGTDYHVSNYYPYWQECPPKRIYDSFFTIYPVMQYCISFLDYMQQSINETPDTDNW